MCVWYGTNEYNFEKGRCQTLRFIGGGADRPASLILVSFSMNFAHIFTEEDVVGLIR